MELWIDAQISPSLALWINNSFENIKAQSLRSVGLRDAKDDAIFFTAKKQNIVVMTKDFDFVRLLEQYGPPPQIIWITAGNTSNSRMREILDKHFSVVCSLLRNGEKLIEIDGK